MQVSFSLRLLRRDWIPTTAPQEPPSRLSGFSRIAQRSSSFSYIFIKILTFFTPFRTFLPSKFAKVKIFSYLCSVIPKWNKHRHNITAFIALFLAPLNLVNSKWYSQGIATIDVRVCIFLHALFGVLYLYTAWLLCCLTYYIGHLPEPKGAGQVAIRSPLFVYIRIRNSGQTTRR